MQDNTLSRRAHPRKLLQGTGWITDPVSHQKHEVTLLDISLGGVAFLTKEVLPAQSPWLVRFPVGDELLTGTIEIAYCIRHLLADAYRAGAQFRRLRPDQLAIIERYTK